MLCWIGGVDFGALGFIEFEDKYDAEDAVRDLDDKRLEGPG